MSVDLRLVGVADANRNDSVRRRVEPSLAISLMRSIWHLKRHNVTFCALLNGTWSYFFMRSNVVPWQGGKWRRRLNWNSLAAAAAAGRRRRCRPGPFGRDGRCRRSPWGGRPVWRVWCWAGRPAVPTAKIGKLDDKISDATWVAGIIKSTRKAARFLYSETIHIRSSKSEAQIHVA